MKLMLIYRDKSTHSLVVDEFKINLKSRGIEFEELDVDSIEGQMKCKAYDIMGYPAVLATKDDGALLKLWQGDPLPTINDVQGAILSSR